MRTSACTRPSKLRLPESTEQADRLPSEMAFDTGSGRGPELPMQVAQPYPTTWKPSASRSSISPACSRYSVTTRDPGASEVFTQGCTFRPRSWALRATSPAPSITPGLEVLVQEVMEAMTTAPSSSVTCSPPISVVAGRLWMLRSCFSAASASRKRDLLSRSGTRSCGRLGPAMLGSTVPMSSSTTLEYSASGWPGRRNRPCSRA